MGVFDRDKFATNSIEWATPDSVFAPLAKEFEFTCDVAATKDNAKCATFFSKDNNGLQQQWTGVCWMNPPYGREVKEWVKKAHESAASGAIVVALLPAKTNTNWWHDYVMKYEVRFLRGRPKFNGAKHGLPFPLAIVVFQSHGGS